MYFRPSPSRTGSELTLDTEAALKTQSVRVGVNIGRQARPGRAEVRVDHRAVDHEAERADRDEDLASGSSLSHEPQVRPPIGARLGGPGGADTHGGLGVEARLRA